MEYIRVVIQPTKITQQSKLTVSVYFDPVNDGIKITFFNTSTFYLTAPRTRVQTHRNLGHMKINNGSIFKPRNFIKYVHYIESDSLSSLLGTYIRGGRG